MPKRLKAMPRFGRGDIVLLSLLDKEGAPKNDLAKEAATYYSESAEVVTLSVTSIDGGDVFAYGVQTNDGNILELTEDCLTPLLSF